MSVIAWLVGYKQSISQPKLMDLGAGVARLNTLQKLQDLNLAYTNVGDIGLEALESLSAVTNLNLDSCAVTDR